MNSAELDERRTHFEQATSTIASALVKESTHVRAMVAKWAPEDLVPGLSDMDFRVICDDETTAEDWVQIDRVTGRVHLDMVREHPEWNRINEHTVGAGMTVSEVLDPRFHNPEYAVWSLWWGQEDWLAGLKAEMASRPFNAADEYVHLSKFLAYYSPYREGIDPPINLGPFEDKYALHSRCWHYFAPPMLAAACLLARRNFSGKREGLSWLREQGFIVGPVEQVLAQVEAHYDTTQRNNPSALMRFEQTLYDGFTELLPSVLEAVQDLEIDQRATPSEIKKQLAANTADPLETLMANLRFARIRAGRYYFYVNAPHHFDADELLLRELDWIRALSGPVFGSLAVLLGDESLRPRECLERLDVTPVDAEERSFKHIMDLAGRSRDDPEVPELFEQAIDLFPHYFRLISRALEEAAAR